MIRSALVSAILAAVLAVLPVCPATPPASAAASVLAYPGMPILQGETRCTLAFIDTIRRIGYSAGHCNTSSEVRDEHGRPLGIVSVWQHNRAGKLTTSVEDAVIDYEAISINPGVEVTNLLGPAFTRPLITQPGVTPTPGMVVCQRGTTTGSSCGVIDAVHDGWFTMRAGGMTSEHGDSGAPVYTYTDETGSTPVIVGILRGLNGGRAAAVSWPDTLRHAIYDAAAATS